MPATGICRTGYVDEHHVFHSSIFVIEPITYYGSYFGAGIYPIVHSNVECGGWEDSLGACAKDGYEGVACTSDQLAGVLCGYGKSWDPMKSCICLFRLQ